MPFEIVRNDITRMQVDAIVNAANNTLLGGGGVDGAIHRAAGPELLEECRTLGGCRTGEAKITGGYRLPCRYVIHTVGPVWEGGGRGERELLASCYLNSLLLAEEYGCASVAFPLISSGVYGYPKDEVLKVATDTIRDFLLEHDLQVYLVVFGPGAFAISQKLYMNIRAYIDDSYEGIEREMRERRSRVSNLPRPDFALPESAPMKPERRDKSALFGRKAESVPKQAMETPDFLMDAECAAAPMASEDLEDLEELRKYLRQRDEGFRDMLLRKIDERQMTDAQCYKKANIDRKLFNKIKNQEDYKPGKSTVLALAIALELPMEEISEMLRKAGYSLARNNTFDLIVEYFLKHGNYDLYEINAALFSFDQKLLGSLQ